MQCVAEDPDFEEIFVDSTIVRVHQHAAGAQKRRPSSHWPIQRTTKSHSSVDALGNPLRCLLTGRGYQPTLIEGMTPERVIGDKGYDADHFVSSIEGMGAQAVIPPRSNRLNPRDYDRHWYEDRNLAERFFNKIKQFRRIATRYEKLDRNFLAILHLVCAFIWLE